MKIAYDAKRALLNHSGLGNYSRTLIRSFLKFYPENKYYLYSTNANKEYSELISQYAKENLFSRYPQSRFWKTFNAFWRRYIISKELMNDGIEIYHGLSHELPVGIEKTGVKSLVTIHDLIFERYPSFYPVLDRMFYRNKIKHACKVATRIIAISEQTKEDLISFYKIDAKKIVVVYQSCESIYEDQTEHPEILSGLQIPEKFILCVGSFNKRKNHLNLLRAFLSIKNHIRMKLVLVGKGGDQYDEVRKFVLQNQIQDLVIFVSDCTNLQLRQIYLKADMLVYPSEFEGFGIPILEAFASDVPVITTDRKIFREAGGDAALYTNTNDFVSLANKIKELVDHPNIYLEKVKKGKEQMKHFQSEKIAKEYFQIYRSILKT